MSAASQQPANDHAADSPKVKAFAPPNIALRGAAPKARGLPSRKLMLTGTLILGGLVAFAFMTGLSHKDRVYAEANDKTFQSAPPPAELRGAPKDYAQIYLGDAEAPDDLSLNETPPANYADLSDAGVAAQGLPPASLAGGPRYAALADREEDKKEEAVRRSPILFGDAKAQASAAFIDHKDEMVSPFRLEKPASQFILQAGAVIPAALRNAVNSDAPGRIIAQVTAPVYDSLTGEYLLIPQGARLIGKYDSGVRYGDRRVRIIWNRLILPNGWSLDLASMAAADASGAAGLSARVDNHLERVALASIFSGALSTAANSAQDRRSSRWAQSVGDAAAQEAASAGGRIVDRELTVRPTLKIPAGAKVRVLVERDLVLKAYSQ